MTTLWWYLGRSAGVVATVLIVLALIWGFRFSGRVTGDRHKPAWWLDLHKYLGGLAFIFSALHVAFIYKDELSDIGWQQVFIPMTAQGWRWGITWGVVGMYIFAGVVFTSWPRKIGSRRTWLAIHLLSIPGALMAGVHAWMVGSSQNELWFRALLLALVAAVTYPAILRLFTALDRRPRRSGSGPKPLKPHRNATPGHPVWMQASVEAGTQNFGPQHPIRPGDRAIAPPRSEVGPR